MVLHLGDKPGGRIATTTEGCSVAASTIGFLSLDTRATGSFGDLKSSWGPRMGELYAMPSFSPATRTDFFQVTMNAVRLHDIVYNSIESVTAMRTAGFATTKDFARLWIVRRGAWALGDDRGIESKVAAGQLLIRRGPMAHIAATPGTRTDFLALPADGLGIGTRSAFGSASSPEARLLVAQATMIRDYAGDLSPAGLLAARNTLVELLKGVAFGAVDETEPQVAPALAHAARKLADQWLTRPGLSVGVLASELNVSVRTLQRAFAAEEETVASYLRERRLSEARRALTMPGRRSDISEIAARWQFADASHFTRLFRQRYGVTPHQFRSGR